MRFGKLCFVGLPLLKLTNELHAKHFRKLRFSKVFFARRGCFEVGRLTHNLKLRVRIQVPLDYRQKRAKTNFRIFFALRQFALCLLIIRMGGTRLRLRVYDYGLFEFSNNLPVKQS